MNLYQWLNARNYARFQRSLTKSVDDIQAGRVHKGLTMEELEEKWAAAEAREAARPLLIRKGRDAYWAARRLARRSTPRHIINRIVWYHQRARRGWSDYDAWSFDSYIARVMSQGMARLAASTHSWPGEQSKWPTFEEWQDHLSSMSVRLGAWNLDTDSFSDKEMFEITKEAMHEFADNFGHYWDLSGRNGHTRDTCRRQGMPWGRGRGKEPPPPPGHPKKKKCGVTCDKCAEYGMSPPGTCRKDEDHGYSHLGTCGHSY